MSMNTYKIAAASAVRRGARHVAWVAAVLASAGTLPANADAATFADSARQSVVRYDDLDLNSEAGALALYERVEAAARRVCPDNGVRDLNWLRAMRACREDAVARAVAAIPSAKVAAIHVERKRVG
jgi:UrcA family protein